MTETCRLNVWNEQKKQQPYCKIIYFFASPGNYGKTSDVVVKSEKTGGQENLAEDRQPLLEPEDELEKQELPVLGSRDQSVTVPRRAQPTEYDG